MFVIAIFIFSMFGLLIWTHCRIECIILDEADRLFELGYVEQIDSILAACDRPGIQRSLFSATIPDGVEQMASTFLVDPIRVTVGYR